jgi:dGTPase
VAYLNHDLADAFRAEVLRPQDLPPEVGEVLGARHSQRIDTMVTDIVVSSWDATGEDGAGPEPPRIAMSLEVRRAVNALRDFMFERVYLPEDAGEEGQAARRVIRLLYAHFDDTRDRIPPEFHDSDRAVVDYIACMTDHFAVRVAEGIEPGVAASLRRGLA